jgi:hypothetical protein
MDGIVYSEKGIMKSGVTEIVIQTKTIGIDEGANMRKVPTNGGTEETMKYEKILKGGGFLMRVKIR